MIPAAFGLYFLAGPIIEVLFHRGQFSVADLENTSLVFENLRFEFDQSEWFTLTAERTGCGSRCARGGESVRDGPGDAYLPCALFDDQARADRIDDLHIDREYAAVFYTGDYLSL